MDGNQVMKTGIQTSEQQFIFKWNIENSKHDSLVSHCKPTDYQTAPQNSDTVFETKGR